MRLRLRVAVVALLICAFAVRAEEATWSLPAPEGVLLVAALTMSERSYTIEVDTASPAECRVPARIEVTKSASDRRVIALARKRIESGKLAQAEKSLNSLLRRKSAQYDALALRALCLLAKGEKDKALADIRKSIIGNRRNPEAWTILGKVAKARGKKVVRPEFEIVGWITPPAADGGVRLGFPCGDDMDALFPWTYYGGARAHFRHEGGFKKAFPREKIYRYTFCEHLFAMGAVVQGAASRAKPLSAGLKRLVAEKKAKTIIPFLYFAAYPEVLPRKPEKGFDSLEPILVKYFDEHILVSP
jgi:tetratricopeptide (TPR) repeat protein